ncbi:MAG: hypothetical protein Ct9H90mP27_0570 [Gammaproteobacteria bacterium]|nr:MAG: hypothetical protein Ct9H90mP27_0570 [Gammaproteobacteria bacterium]
MAVSLIEHEVIKTTVVKAKELRRFAEPLITLSKEDILPIEGWLSTELGAKLRWANFFLRLVQGVKIETGLH